MRKDDHLCYIDTYINFIDYVLLNVYTVFMGQ